MRFSQETSEKTVWQNSGACATDHRAAVQETEMRQRDQEPHSGGRSLTANNDYAVTEYHTVVLKTSADHAVAESQSRRPERKGTLLYSTRPWKHEAPTANQRPRSSAVLRGGLEVPEEAFAEW